MKKWLCLLMMFLFIVLFPNTVGAEEVPEVPEVPKVPGTDDDNETIDDNGSHETIITLPRKYSKEDEEGKITLTLNPDNTFKIEMIDLEDVIIATIHGTYKTIEENIVELYAPTKDELFDTIELFEDTNTWDFYYSEDIPPIVDEPIIEEPVKSEIGIWFEEKVLPIIFTFIASLFGSGAIFAILSKLVNKLFDNSKKKLEEELAALKLSQEQNELIKEKFDQLERFTYDSLSKINTYFEMEITPKMNQIIEESNISKEQYLATKEKAMKLAESLLEHFNIETEGEVNAEEKNSNQDS